MKFTYPKLGVLTLTKVNNNHFLSSFSQNSHINLNCISVSVLVSSSSGSSQSQRFTSPFLPTVCH